tara:strand:+ start:277 stop:477 length:201 start_codon:yes stop_codon:yes gene_type:complete
MSQPTNIAAIMARIAEQDDLLDSIADGNLNDIAADVMNNAFWADASLVWEDCDSTNDHEIEPDDID